MSFIDPFLQPGMGDPTLSVENEFTWGPIDRFQLLGIVLDSASIDAGSTPTTTLRSGLTLGKITASGKWKQYDPTAADGSQIPLGFLRWARNMLDPRTAAAGDRQASVLLAGPVKVGSLFGFDENARAQFGSRFLYDDLRFEYGAFLPVVAKTANYQVVNDADNGVHFTTTGNAAPITFTLPATVKRGQRFRFTNTVGQNMIVAAAAGKLITFNNAAATSVAFQTAGNLIGGTFEIVPDDTATKWMALPYGANTVTVA